MKKLLAILLLSIPALGTTTFTGHIGTLGTTSVTTGSFVRFWLRGCGGNQPRVGGLTVIAPSQGAVFFFDFKANSTGDVTGTLYSNRDATGLTDGEIECGGSHTSTWYGMQIFYAGKGGPEIPILAKNTDTFDVSNITPITTAPVTTAPSGDSTYLRLDAGNGPLTGALQINGTLTACGVGGVAYVGSGNPYSTCWGSVDIGAQINAAYAALPANGGTIVVVPKSDNSCHTFTTPIVATTSGKYLLLESLQSGGVSTGCLNFTPSTGSAMTFDYVPVGGARGGLYGVRDLWLNNNQCISIGGCATTNTGISVSNTNGGIDGAMMENVTIQGFTAGYTENARIPTAAVQWINPHIFNNLAGMILYNSAEEEIVGGAFYGNGVHIQAADSTSHPEMHITGTFFVAHSIEAFDFTRTSLEGSLYISDVHLENGATTSINAHYVEGNLEVFGKGGVAEDDSTSGTADWWFKPSSGVFMWDGLEVVTASRNPTIGILNLASNTRAKLTGFVVNPATLTAIVGGANAGKATVCMLSGDISNVASACKIEAPLQDVSGLAYSRTIASGTATMTTALIGAGACGTTVTVAASGVLTTDGIADSFNSAVAASPGVLIVEKWPTANNVNFAYCNPTAAGVTPTAATLNWRVIR